MPKPLSPTQQRIYDLLEQHGGNQTAVAKEMGLSYSTISTHVRKIRSKGHKPVTQPSGSNHHGIPAILRDDPASYIYNPAPGERLIGRSTLHKEIGPDGEPVQQWVKTKVDQPVEDARQAIEEAARVAFEELPSIRPLKYALKPDKDIIPWFNIGDGHLGMVAYHAETGGNFDLKIAERELCTAMAALIDRCDPCERCVINDLGDMTHYENFTGITEGSGHLLDFDSRFPKMIRVYVQTMLFIVNKALEKFKYVDVIINQGNHSRTNDIWMRMLLKAKFDTNRVTVLDNENVFIPYRMGNTFVMVHHSDKCKPNKLADVMATDYRHDFGEARYKYIDIGHIHHRSMAKENGDVIIESWNQLAPPDKYSHEGGWRSRSFLSVVYRSKTYGEKGRQTITAEEVKDMIDKAKPGTAAQARREVYTVN